MLDNLKGASTHQLFEARVEQTPHAVTVCVEDSYQLSPMQQGMLFHSLLAPHSGVYIQQMVITLHEELNVTAFMQAWERVVERHAVLRTTYHWENQKEPLQDVHSHVSLQQEQHDWRGLPSGEQNDRLQAYLRSDRLRDFDLAKAPPMRLALFQLGESHYQLIWTFHHILLDGYSFPLLLKEVFCFYEAFLIGQDLQLKQPPPYRDYIEWLQQQDWSKAETYWRQALKGFIAPTPLVVDQTPSVGIELSRDALPGRLYKEQKIRLCVAVTSALQSLAEQHQLTVNTLVQGAWALLLSRYSGEQDVVFGATRRCRQSALPGAESMVGLFINTLPVRARVSPDLSLLTWLKELRAQWIAIREYEHTPLVKIQGWSDVPGGTPLFESILVFENSPLNSTLRSLGGSWENREFQLWQQTNYPLMLTGYLEPELLLKITYDCGRFNDSTIARMLGHVKMLLEGIVANPEQKISDLPLLTAAERQTLLVDWNQTQTDYPVDVCIHQMFEAQVERSPDAVAVVFEDQQLTYKELNRRANQLAHYLMSLGVRPEVLVGICAERSLEMVVGLLGILKAGGAYVPLDPAYPLERLAFILEDAQVQVLLTLARLVDSLPQNQARVVCLDSTDAPAGRLYESVTRESEANPVTGSEAARSAVKPNNLAYVIYTSGSTGKPKGVAIEHHSTVALLDWAREVFTTEARAGVLASTSICFDLSVFELFVPLSWGGKVILVENALHLPQLAAALEVTLINTVPSAIAELVRVDGVPDSVLLVNLAGEPLQNRLVQQLYQQNTIQQVFNLYGPSEDTTYSTFALVKKGGNSSPPIGRPIANTQVYLLDAQMQPVPIGVPGELYIGGAGLARGYLNRPELTALAFIPNPFSDKPGDPAGYARRAARLYKTGDLARYLPDGNIEFLGRIDHQVKIRGYRIELGEIEAVLSQHPDVREAVVIARSDLPGQQRLVAYVVSKLTPDRVPYQSECLAEFERNTVKLSTEDISIGGVCLVGVPAICQPGQLVRLHLHLPVAAEAQWLEGYVVWQQGQEAGIQFALTPTQQALVQQSVEYLLETQGFLKVLQRTVSGNLRNFLKQKVPDYMVPSSFVFLNALPLTPNGKVDRKALPAPEGFNSESAATYVAPKTDLEQTIATVWQQVLHIEKVGIHDNFFELGGHSLLIAQVHCQLREQLKKDVSMVELFKYPTISSLASYLSQDDSEKSPAKQSSERANKQKQAINRHKQRKLRQ